MGLRRRDDGDRWIPAGPGATDDGELDLVMQMLLLPARAWRALGLALAGLVVLVGGIVVLSLFPDAGAAPLTLVPMVPAVVATPWALIVAARWWRRYRALRRTGWHLASAVRKTGWEHLTDGPVSSRPRVNELISVHWAEGGTSQVVAVGRQLPVGAYPRVWLGGERRAMVLLLPESAKVGRPRPVAVRGWTPIAVRPRPTGKHGR